MVAKREIAYSDEFLLLSKCFQCRLLQMCQKAYDCVKGFNKKQLSSKSLSDTKVKHVVVISVLPLRNI